MKQGISIAIDGPAGSGKSTIAKLIAVKFGYLYIDTGAMYRAITLKALQQGVSPQDEKSLAELAMGTKIVLRDEKQDKELKLRVFLDEVEVTHQIRSLEVTNNASAVAAVAAVRTNLVKMQRQMAAAGGVVMDGRDIGTVVLPHAELKLFLTASIGERSRRRFLELEAKGVSVTLAELEEQIRHRDFLDSNRQVDPLCQATDAIFLDTTSLTIDQVVEKIIELSLEKGAALDVCN